MKNLLAVVLVVAAAAATTNVYGVSNGTSVITIQSQLRSNQPATISAFDNLRQMRTEKKCKHGTYVDINALQESSTKQELQAKCHGSFFCAMGKAIPKQGACPEGFKMISLDSVLPVETSYTCEREGTAPIDFSEAKCASGFESDEADVATYNKLAELQKSNSRSFVCKAIVEKGTVTAKTSCFPSDGSAVYLEESDFFPVNWGACCQ